MKSQKVSSGLHQRLIWTWRLMTSRALTFLRRFELAEGQFRPTSLIERPGFPSIDDQINRIKPGDYTFLDDDIASGANTQPIHGFIARRCAV